MELSKEMREIVDNGPGPSRKNVYMCRACGHGFVSIDLDEGVTPFMTSCLNPGCNGHAQSFMYGAPQTLLDAFPPAIEWYKPTFSERKKLPAGARHHCEKGGLLSRAAAPKGGAA